MIFCGSPVNRKMHTKKESNLKLQYRPTKDFFLVSVLDPKLIIFLRISQYNSA